MTLPVGGGGGVASLLDFPSLAGGWRRQQQSAQSSRPRRAIHLFPTVRRAESVQLFSFKCLNSFNGVKD